MLRYNSVKSQLLFGAQQATGKFLALVRQRFGLAPPPPPQE